MNRIQFARMAPHKRLLAGVVGLIGLMAALAVGGSVALVAADYLTAQFVALALGCWIAATAYSRAWNRWSPWAPDVNQGEP